MLLSIAKQFGIWLLLITSVCVLALFGVTVFQSNDGVALTQSKIVFVASAQARETRAERRERLRAERKQRSRRSNDDKTDEPPALSTATDTVIQSDTTVEAAPGSGPNAFSDDMVGFLGVPAEEKKPVPVEKAQEEEPLVDKPSSEEAGRTSRRQKREKRQPRRKRSEVKDAQESQQAMRGEIYAKLEEAQQLFQAKAYDAAIAVLDKLRALKGRKTLQSNELANIWNFYAFIYYSKEQYQKAINAYKQVISQPGAGKAMVDKTQYALAQLHMVKEDYPAAIKAFETWFKTAEKATPDSYATLAQAYVQVKNYDKALYNMEKGIRVASAQKKRPKEQWFSVLRFLYNEKGLHKKELETVKVLLKYWPKRKYWLGLAGLYGQMDQSRKQMQILNTLYIQNSLERESELVSLAQMFAAAEVPYKAANIMERGFKQEKIKKTNKNLERTGEYWRQAYEMEKALPMLEQASKNAPDGKSSERLAYIYYSLNKFAESASAATRAISKGGLRDVNAVRMLQGQSLFNIQKFDEAAQVFTRVSKESRDESQRNMAEQWIGYMEREKIREQEIKQYLKS